MEFAEVEHWPALMELARRLADWPSSFLQLMFGKCYLGNPLPLFFAPRLWSGLLFPSGYGHFANACENQDAENKSRKFLGHFGLNNRLRLHSLLFFASIGLCYEHGRQQPSLFSFL